MMLRHHAMILVLVSPYTSASKKPYGSVVAIRGVPGKRGHPPWYVSRATSHILEPLEIGCVSEAIHIA